MSRPMRRIRVSCCAPAAIGHVATPGSVSRWKACRWNCSLFQTAMLRRYGRGFLNRGRPKKGMGASFSSFLRTSLRTSFGITKVPLYSTDAGDSSLRETAWWRTHSNATSLQTQIPDNRENNREFLDFGPFGRFSFLIREQFQLITTKFPTQRNRELFWRNREAFEGTGNFQQDNRDAGLVPREPIQSGGHLPLGAAFGPKVS